jgi:tetratricopeptide (TPR) repeat protein
MRAKSRQSPYHQGLVLFAREKLPFAARSNRFFAAKLVRLFTRLAQNLSPPYHLYELGCGQGILAYWLLHRLKHYYPMLYQKSFLHLSDFSKATINDLKTLSLWEPFASHVDFSVMDASKPHFSHQSQLIYHVNLFDALTPAQRLQSLSLCLQALDSKGLLFISDFGTTKPQASQYQLSFGPITPHSVDFTALLAHAPHHFLTQNPFGQQDCLLSPSRLKTYTALFNRLFTPDNTDALVSQFLAQLKTSTPATLWSAYQRLPHLGQIDYLVLNDFGQYLVKRGFTRESLILMRHLRTEYLHGHGVYYHLIRGEAFEKTSRLKLAEAEYLKATATGYPRAFAYLSNYYWRQQNYRAYIQTLKQYLKVTRKPDHLHTLHNIATAYHLLGQDKQAFQTLNQLVTLAPTITQLPGPERQALTAAQNLLNLES